MKGSISNLQSRLNWVELTRCLVATRYEVIDVLLKHDASVVATIGLELRDMKPTILAAFEFWVSEVHRRVS